MRGSKGGKGGVGGKGEIRSRAFSEAGAGKHTELKAVRVVQAVKERDCQNRLRRQERGKLTQKTAHRSALFKKLIYLF